MRCRRTHIFNYKLLKTCSRTVHFCMSAFAGPTSAFQQQLINPYATIQKCDHALTHTCRKQVEKCTAASTDTNTSTQTHKAFMEHIPTPRSTVLLFLIIYN